MRTDDQVSHVARRPTSRPKAHFSYALSAIAVCVALGLNASAQAGQSTTCPMAVMGNPNGSVCNASDVAVAAAIVGPGSTGAYCFPGDQFTVNIAADLTIRSNRRWDVGIWIARDGLAIDETVANGGAQNCEVLPLPPTDTWSDTADPMSDPPSISSWDDFPDATPSSQDQCGDTDGIQNPDTVSDVLLTFGVNPTAYNGPITLTCLAGPGGGVVLNSLVSWNQNDSAICNPTISTTYDPQSSKCSVNTGEIAVDIVGRVTIVKSAPGGGGNNFDFAWTNDSPPTDPNLNPASNPFTLQDGESDEIYAVIGDDGTATVTVTEQNLPFGWNLGSIVCSGDDTTPVVVNGNEVTVTLSYNDANPANSQDDVTCTFNNAPASPALTLDKSSPTADYDDPADTISYSYLVSNSGNVPLAFPVTVADNKVTVSCPADDGGAPNNGDAVLDPGESITCSASYDVMQADIDAGSVTNMATASAGGTQSNQDTVTVNAVQNPLMTVVKSSPTTQITAPGGVGYAYLVTNTGNVTLTNIALTDDNDEDDMDCPSTTLAPGADMTCTASHTVTQAELNQNGSPTPDSGFLSNTVTATSDEAPNAQSSLDIPIVENRSLAVTKTGVWNDDGSTPNIAEVGETVSYTITVANDGNVDLIQIDVTDPLITGAPNNGTISCPGGNPIPLLQVGDPPVDCTATYTLVQADVNAGSVVNTATATSFGGATDNDMETVNLPSTLGLSLVKTGSFNDDITADGFAEAGETISYTFDVTNNSSVTVNNVSVTDPLIGAIDCTPEANPIADLAPAESVQCTGSYTLLQADVDAGQVDNTATADSDETEQTTDDETVVLNQNLDWTITKSGSFQDESGDGSAQVGETIAYTFTIENTGFVTLTNIAVTDPKVATITCPGGNPIPSLAPGAMAVCTGSYTLVQADLDAGQVTNTATGDPDETPPGNDGEVTPLPGASAMTIEKTSGTTEITGLLTVQYSYLVTNTGSTSLSGIVLTDDNDEDDMSCPSANLGAGESMVCTASHIVSQDEIDANGSPVADSGVLANTVSGSATELAEPVTDDLSIPFNLAPAMTVQKNSPTEEVTAEGPVTYNYLVTNTGSVTLTGISLTDDNVDGPVDCGGVTQLAPGEDMTCSATHTVTLQELEDNGSPTPGSGVLFNQVVATSNEAEDAGDDLSIPINYQAFTTFLVTKDFTDGNTGEVEVRLTCNTGLPLVQKFIIAEGEPVNFVVENFEPGTMDCRVEEITAGTTGYTSSYAASAIDGTADAIRSEEDGCFYDLVEGGAFACELTNTLDAVEIVVTKEWVGDVEQIEAAVGLGANADYSCYDVLTAPDGVLTTLQGSLYFNGNSTDTIGGLYPRWDGSPYCVITEGGVDSSVESDDSDCAMVEIAPGMDGACTIVNTVFFEGIPTLNQYGLILLALLMLGVGAVGFRRYA